MILVGSLLYFTHLLNMIYSYISPTIWNPTTFKGVIINVLRAENLIVHGSWDRLGRYRYWPLPTTTLWENMWVSIKGTTSSWVVFVFFRTRVAWAPRFPKNNMFFVFRITCLCKRSKQKSPPEETNMSPKKGPFQKERMVFQPLFFRGHVSFWVGIFLKQIQVDWWCGLRFSYEFVIIIQLLGAAKQFLNSQPPWPPICMLVEEVSFLWSTPKQMHQNVCANDHSELQHVEASN